MNLETRCVKIKLKPDSIEKVRAWANTINERKTEALATLRDESVILEAVFLDQNTEGDFLIYVMKAESSKKPKKPLKLPHTRLTNTIKILKKNVGKTEKDWKG